MTDIDSYGTVVGGEYEDYKHLPLMFPSETIRRQVSIYVHSYVGMSIGAVHWYADVEEEDNWLIDHEKRMRRRPWGMWELPHLKGESFRESRKSKSLAIERTIELLQEHFSPDTHYVHLKYDTPAKRFEDLGYFVDSMYRSEQEDVDWVRAKLAARYKTGDI